MHEKQTLIPPKWVRYGKQTLRYAVLIFLAFIFFMPFFWMVPPALKGRDVIFINPPHTGKTLPKFLSVCRCSAMCATR